MNEIFKLFDQYPAIPIGMFAFVLLLAYVNRRGKKRVHQEAAPRQNNAAGTKGFLLPHILFGWSPDDPVTVADMLRSIAIFGASGSGKTSGSGYFIAQHLAKCKRIGGL